MIVDCPLCKKPTYVGILSFRRSILCKKCETKEKKRDKKIYELIEECKVIQRKAR